MKNRSAAIRSMHVSEGYGNPLELLERVYFVLDGHKRTYAHKPRRYPVPASIRSIPGAPSRLISR